MNIWIFLAGLNAAMAVAGGAYGWHALGGTPDIRDIFMMGSQYQMWHALGMMGVGLMIAQQTSKALHLAGGLFQVGILLFSGTLYSFGGLSLVPIEGAAPFGGGLLVTAWLILGIVGSRKLRPA